MKYYYIINNKEEYYSLISMLLATKVEWSNGALLQDFTPSAIYRDDYPIFVYNTDNCLTWGGSPQGMKERISEGYQQGSTSTKIKYRNIKE